MRICPRCGKTYDDAQAFCSVDGSSLSTASGASPFGESSSAEPRALAPGTVLGHYRITSLLGKGGMGVVYGAAHVRLGRKAALKVLRGEFIEDPAIVRRFFDEARAANQVGHEHVVEIFDFIEEPGVRAYVMELLEGAPLSKVIGTPSFTLARALAIARQTAQALAAVHAAGIIHRDLKPDNIFLTTRGKQQDFVKLLDFGVAKLLEIGDGNPLTQTGMVLGTPAYMAPEQLKGAELDRRSDVYSFGVILFEMVTGQRPFRAKTIPELMLKHVAEPPPRPSEMLAGMPPMLEDLILRCLEKEKTARPRDMTEVELAVTELMERAASPNERTVVVPSQAGMPTKESDPAGLADVDSMEAAAAGFDDDDRLFDDEPEPEPAPAPPPARAESPRDPLATPSPATRSDLGLVLPPAAAPTVEEEPVVLPKSRLPLAAAAVAVVVVIVAAAAVLAPRSSGDAAAVTPPPSTEPAAAAATPVEAQPVEAQPVEAPPVEAKPVAAKPVEAPPVEEAKPVDGKPAEAPAKRAHPVVHHATPERPRAKPVPKAKPKEVPVDPFAG